GRREDPHCAGGAALRGEHLRALSPRGYSLNPTSEKAEIIEVIEQSHLPAIGVGDRTPDAQRSGGVSDVARALSRVSGSNARSVVRRACQTRRYPDAHPARRDSDVMSWRRIHRFIEPAS